MLAESVRVGWKVALSWIPTILWVDCIRVILKGEVSITVKEVAVNCAALIIPFVLNGRVLTLYHGGVSNIFWLFTHGWIWLQVRPVVPCIGLRCKVIGGHTSKEETHCETRPTRVVAESSACKMTRINLWEVVYPSLKRHDRDASSFNLIRTTNIGSKRPRKYWTDHPMYHEGELVLTLELALIFPWDSLWTGRVLTEPVRNPWIALEIFLKPIDVFNLLFERRVFSRPQFENFVSFLCNLVQLFILVIIKPRLAIKIMVGIVELTRHLLLLI